MSFNTDTVAHVAGPQRHKALDPTNDKRPRKRWVSSPWVDFTLRRLGGVLLSFVLLVVVTFLIVPLIPGDPAQAIAGTDASPEAVEQIRQRLGLNDPMLVQFGNYVAGLLQLDLGNSFRFGLPVVDIVSAKLPFTAQLALASIVFVLLIGIPLGMLVGILTRGGRHGWLDSCFSNGAGFFAAAPPYVIGTLLILGFAILWPVLPAAGADSLSSLILPTLALAIGPAAAVARVVRRETSTVLEQDFMRTARGKRLSTSKLYLRHALPNLLTSTLTLTGMILASLLGGAVIVETVFNYPGIGEEIIQAIIYRDYPVIQGIILTVGMIATLLTVLVDVILGLIDPRTLGSKTHG